LILKFSLFERNLLGFNSFTSDFYGLKLTLPRSAFFFWIIFNILPRHEFFDLFNALSVLFNARRTLSWQGARRTIYPDQGTKVNVFSSLPQLAPTEFEYRFVNRAGYLLSLYLSRRSEYKSSVLEIFRSAKHDVPFLFPYDRVEIADTGPYSSVESFVKLHLYTSAYTLALKHSNFSDKLKATNGSAWSYVTLNLSSLLGFFASKSTFFYKTYSAYVAPFATFATFYGTDSRALFYLFFQHVRHRKVLEWV
jgi:hypothetical protein